MEGGSYIEVLRVGSKIGSCVCFGSSASHEWDRIIGDFYIAEILIVLHQYIVFWSMLLDHICLEYQRLEVGVGLYIVDLRDKLDHFLFCEVEIGSCRKI